MCQRIGVLDRGEGWTNLLSGACMSHLGVVLGGKPHRKMTSGSGSKQTSTVEYSVYTRQGCRIGVVPHEF